MAEKVWKDCGVFVDGWNFTGYSNTVELNLTQDIIDATVFGSSWRKRKVGLRAADVSVGGFWSAQDEVSTGYGGAQCVPTSGPVDSPIFNKFAGTTGALSILPDGTDWGQPAYIMSAISGEYSVTGTIGELVGFTLNLQSNSAQVVRGRVMREGLASTSISSNTGVTTTVDLGTNPTNVDICVAIHAMYSTTTNKDMTVAVIGSSTSDFAAGTTMLAWGCANWDSSMGGKSKYGTTKVSSTKIRYYRMQFGSSAGSTMPRWYIMATIGTNSTV